MSYRVPCPANWFIRLHSDKQIHTGHMFTHKHTTYAFSPQPCPFRDQWPYWAWGAFSWYIISRCLLVHYDDSFHIFLFCGISYFKLAKDVLRDDSCETDECSDRWSFNLSRSSWTRLQFVFECRAAPHCYFVSLITLWKYQLGNFPIETKKYVL